MAQGERIWFLPWPCHLLACFSQVSNLTFFEKLFFLIGTMHSFENQQSAENYQHILGQPGSWSLTVMAIACILTSYLVTQQ